MIKLIVAGNYQQAKSFAKSIRLKYNEYLYVSTPNSLRGMVDKLEVYRVGTWYEREDIYEIDRALLRRKAIEIKIIKEEKNEKEEEKG